MNMTIGGYEMQQIKRLFMEGKSKSEIATIIGRTKKVVEKVLPSALRLPSPNIAPSDQTASE